MDRAVRILCCICLVGSSFAPDTWVVRLDGVGPVKVGMGLSQLNAALHENFTLPEQKGDQGCFYVHPRHHPHVGFMIEDGRLVRVDVETPGTATVEGIQVGDPESRAITVYGDKLKVEPHKYIEPEGHYLTVGSTDGKYGVRFETDHGKIVTFYAGSYKAIQYVEGCS